MTLSDRLLARRDAKRDAIMRQQVAEQALGILKSAGVGQNGIQASMPGAYGSWTRSAGGKYPGGTDANLAGITWNHWQARQQARDLVHHSTEAGALVYRFADLVVDKGLGVIPEPRWDIIGIDPASDQAQKWISTARTAFDLWASSKNQNRSGQISFYEEQHLYQVYSERDNDQFTRLYYNPDKSLLNPLQFELLDTNQIRGDAVTSTLIVGKFMDGIERDTQGRETLYHCWVQQSSSTPGYDTVDVPRLGPGGLPNMLHAFKSDYAGQGRGLTPFVNTLQNFQDIENYKLAELQKAINQASITFVMENDQQPPGNPVDQLGRMAAGASDIIAGAPGAVSGVGSAAMTVDNKSIYTPLEEATFKQPGVAIFGNDQGDHLKPGPTTSPAGEFGPYIDANMEYLTARHGMALEVLKMIFGDNYSASRGTLLLVYRVIDMKRDRMDTDLISPVYEAWLSGEIAAGRISCPGWQDPRIRSAWTSHRLHGAPMPNIDPNSTAKADQLLVEMGAKTLDDVAMETNGSSGKANRLALVEQADELGKVRYPWTMTGLGLATAPDPNGAQPKGANGQPQPAKKPAPGGSPK
jgi:capsid protein